VLCVDEYVSFISYCAYVFVASVLKESSCLTCVFQAADHIFVFVYSAIIVLVVVAVMFLM
jgi:hypothetical protein